MMTPFEWVVGDSSKDHTVTALPPTAAQPPRYTTLRGTTHASGSSHKLLDCLSSSHHARQRPRHPTNPAPPGLCHLKPEEPINRQHHNHPDFSASSQRKTRS